MFFPRISIKRVLSYWCHCVITMAWVHVVYIAPRQGCSPICLLLIDNGSMWWWTKCIRLISRNVMSTHVDAGSQEVIQVLNIVALFKVSQIFLRLITNLNLNKKIFLTSYHRIFLSFPFGKFLNLYVIFKALKM